VSTQTDTVAQTVGVREVAPPVMSVTRVFYWSVRREFWENRSIYLAPLAVAGVFLIGFLITLVHLPTKIRILAGVNPADFRAAIVVPYDSAAGLMMVTTIFVSVYYCLETLHSERRDRSILFWKSLPVSDLVTVLAKVIIPLVILPVITSAIAAALHLIMLVLSSVVLLAAGVSPAPLWAQLPWLHMSLLLFYHILTAHALWPAPIYGWLLFVSAWARRAPFLWASLPVAAIGGVEAIAFGTSHFLTFVGRRLIGDATTTAFIPPENFPTNPMTHITPGPFLISSGLWVGLLITAAFVFAAIRLRRYREPV